VGRGDPWHSHVLRWAWLALVAGGAAYVRSRDPDSLALFLGSVAGGWALTRIVSEAIESFGVLLAWLGEEDDET